MNGDDDDDDTYNKLYRKISLLKCEMPVICHRQKYTHTTAQTIKASGRNDVNGEGEKEHVYVCIYS